jgi:beta-N-acetylhexosaminidase
MTLQIQIGQLLIIGFDGTEMHSALASLLREVQPAGVILFARNITGAEQTWKLLRDCQAGVKTPLFTCVDLEGGKVDRFRMCLVPRRLRRTFLRLETVGCFENMDG